MFLLRWISFRGRIPLSRFWLTYALPLFGSYWLTVGVDAALFGTSTWIRTFPSVPTAQAAEMQYTLRLGGPITAVWSWVGWLPWLAGMTKRWHDRGRSGWWNLLLLLPVIGWVWLLISLGCRDGTRGVNRYGPDPLGSPT